MRVYLLWHREYNLIYDERVERLKGVYATRHAADRALGNRPPSMGSVEEREVLE